MKKTLKKVKQGVKDYGNMFKSFHEAWKGRKDSYDSYVKTYDPKD